MLTQYMKLTHLILLEHHEIKVGYALVVIASHPLVKILGVDDFSDVLDLVESHKNASIYF